jgi:methyl-accepting chemotaxis protein
MRFDSFGWSTEFQMQRVLSRYGVSTQVTAIGVMALIGFVLIGALYAYGATTRDGVQAEVDDALEERMQMDEILVDILELRSHEKDFLLHRNQASLTKHAALVEEVTNDLDTMDSHLEEASARAELGALESDFKAYASQFQKLVQAYTAIGLTQDDGLRGALRKAAREIEDNIAGGQNLAAQVSLLTMRRHEKDFIEREDPQYVEALGAEAGKLGGLIGAAGAEHLAAYRQAFLDLAKATASKAAEAKKISATFASMEPRVGALAKVFSDLAATHRAAANATQSSIGWLMAVGILVIGGGSVAGSLIVGRLISQPIGALTVAMRGLAAGNKAIEIPARGRGDEIGAMAEALGTFRDTAVEADRLAVQQKAEQEERVKRADRLNAIVSKFNEVITGIVQGVAGAATELQATAEGMAMLAKESAEQAALAAAASEESSANVQTVASAGQEMASSVSEISRQVAKSSEIAETASREARQANSEISSLVDAAQSIGDVVQMISEIAGQTNLLALNATIEAARAGEAGKGFAVVASEVKALANQTGRATEEISKKIGDMQRVTQSSAQTVARVGEVIAEINHIAAAIAAAIEEQGAATQEIARNVDEAAKGTQSVSSNVARVNESAKETGASAGNVLDAAQDLSRQAEALRGSVDEFTVQIKAA